MKKASSFFRILLSASLLLSMTSCKADIKEFPELSFEDDGDVQESTDEMVEETLSMDITNSVYSLSVALPYSQDTVSRLLKLYYLKQTDSMPEQTFGSDINLEYLDSVNTPWIVNVINIPNEGVDVTTIESWSHSGGVPDLFLVSDFDTIVDSNYAEPLDNYLGDNDMSSCGLYGNAITGCMTTDGTYGIPLYQSFIVLYGNQDYIDGSEQLPFRNTYSDFRDYLINIDGLYNNGEEDAGIVPLARGYELIPYITGGSYMMMDADLASDSLDAGVERAVTYVDDLYNSGITSNYDNEGLDPVISRRAAFWLDSSTNMQRWSEYYPNSIYYSLPPIYSDNSTVNLFATVYPVCLSTSCDNKDFAADFAAFICMDLDALMLIQRLEPTVGYYPVSDSDFLWEIICGDDVYGSVSMIFRQNLDNAIYCPPRSSSIAQQVNDYCSDYYAYYESDDLDINNRAPFNLEECLG